MHAFGKEEGLLIFDMVGEMLSELETLSINIEQKKRIVGNIIFTSFKLNDHPDKKCYLLAPIGVLPELQGYGLGNDLIERRDGTSKINKC